MTNDDWRSDPDWEAAFEYAGHPTGYGMDNSSPDIIALGECNTAPFSIPDVAEVYKMDEGENDGPDWIMWGKLNDGRHFFLQAGCDYTGWDCQAGGCTYVSMNKDRLIHSAMDIQSRRRFGLHSVGDESDDPR